MIVKFEVPIPAQAKRPYDEEFFLIFKDAILYIVEACKPTSQPVTWGVIGYGVAYVEMPEIGARSAGVLLAKVTAVLNKYAPRRYPLLEPCAIGYDLDDKDKFLNDVAHKSKALYELYVENDVRKDNLFPDIDILPYERMPALFREGLVI